MLPLQKFYVAKVQRKNPPHALLGLITVYAHDDASAEAAVSTLSDVVPGDHVTVRAVRPLHESFFGRSSTDGLGAVQHSDISWSGKGPFEPIDLFEPSAALPP
jgi:hypothetical protein